MTYGAAYDGWKALAASLTGLQAVWRDRTRPIVSDTTRAIVYLSIVAIATVGVDERRTEYDETRDHQEFVDTVVGRRRAMVRFQVESYEQGNGKTAPDYLETLRLRLRWTASMDALHAFDCALIKPGDIIDVPTFFDDHAKSSAACDCAFSLVCTAEELAGYTYIASFSGTMAFDGGDPRPFTGTA